MTRPTSPTSSFFFFNDTATTEIYTLSLHDALPISLAHYDAEVDDASPQAQYRKAVRLTAQTGTVVATWGRLRADRKSTRLNSSHLVISYAVFCLKKKKQPQLSTQGLRCTSLIDVLS